MELLWRSFWVVLPFINWGGKHRMLGVYLEGGALTMAFLDLASHKKLYRFGVFVVSGDAAMMSWRSPRPQQKSECSRSIRSTDVPSGPNSCHLGFKNVVDGFLGFKKKNRVNCETVYLDVLKHRRSCSFCGSPPRFKSNEPILEDLMILMWADAVESSNRTLHDTFIILRFTYFIGQVYPLQSQPPFLAFSGHVAGELDEVRWL